MTKKKTITDQIQMIIAASRGFRDKHTFGLIEETLPNSFHETTVMLTPKPHKDSTKKEK